MTSVATETLPGNDPGRPNLTMVPGGADLAGSPDDNARPVMFDHTGLFVTTSPTLGQLVTEIGSRYLEVIAAPRGLDVPARTAVIWDGSGSGTLGAGDVILAVGFCGTSPALSDLLDRAAEAGAACVAVKVPINREWVRSEGARTGIAVLAVPRQLMWSDLYDSIRATVAVSPSASEHRAPIGDLFSLANAAAASLGAPVEIDDADMQVLVSSNLGHDIDELRRESILSRTAPTQFLDWMWASGMARHLRDAHEPVHVQAPGSRPRLAMPIRAGIDLLGYIWVSEDAEPFSSSHERELAEVARIASVSMLRLRATEDVERRLRSDMFSSAIEGTGSTDVLADQLGAAPGDEYLVIGFEPHAARRLDPIERAHVHNLVALRVELVTHQGTAVAVGERCYAIVPVASTTTDSVNALAAKIIDHAANQLHVQLSAAIGDPISGLSRLAHARVEVDRILNILATSDGPRIGTSDQLHPRAVLCELQELAQERPHLLNGRIAVLEEIDRTRKTEYITTLKAYFDAAFDPARAARQLYVHRNTLRYRLRRIEEVSGLDLDDPAERLVAELQLRLMPTA